MGPRATSSRVLPPKPSGNGVQREALDPEIDAGWARRGAFDDEVERNDAVERELRALGPRGLRQRREGDLVLLRLGAQHEAGGEVAEAAGADAGAALGGGRGGGRGQLHR